MPPWGFQVRWQGSRRRCTAVAQLDLLRQHGEGLPAVC